MGSILDKIVEYKKEELAARKRKISPKDMEKRAMDAAPPRPFLSAFQKNRTNIIAEIKKASPSAGVIRADFRPVDLAFELEEAGAAALSVLTDEHFFQGSLSSLEEIVHAVNIPCLRKDFTLDAYHVYEARSRGADALLLIAAILENSLLKDLNDLASELHMAAVIEVHDEEDLKKARAITRIAPTTIIGINNRDLRTFQTRLETSLDLAPKIPTGICRIAESGLNHRADIEKLQSAGFDGFLIGEALMRAKDPGRKLRELKE